MHLLYKIHWKKTTSVCQLQLVDKHLIVLELTIAWQIISYIAVLVSFLISLFLLT